MHTAEPWLRERKVVELRALLRFLHLKGLTELSLAEAVPPVAGWRDTGVPMTVPSADIERLLASCDHTTVAGCHDFAILLLLPGWASVRRKWPGWSSTTWTGVQAKSSSAAKLAARTACRCRATSRRSPSRLLVSPT